MSSWQTSCFTLEDDVSSPSERQTIRFSAEGKRCAYSDIWWLARARASQTQVSPPDSILLMDVRKSSMACVIPWATFGVLLKVMSPIWAARLYASVRFTRLSKMYLDVSSLDIDRASLAFFRSITAWYAWSSTCIFNTKMCRLEMSSWILVPISPGFQYRFSSPRIPVPWAGLA